MNRAFGLLLLAMSGLAHAADRPSADTSRIDGRTAEGATGAVAINVAAGVGNVQGIERSIATGAAGVSWVDAVQRTDATQGDRGRDAVALIEGSAFSGGRGVLGVNQAAGAANAQLNVLAIGVGTETGGQFIQHVDNAVLAATAAPATRAGADPRTAASGLREARIDGAGALRDTQGVVQINQSAGVGNASMNAIVLQLPGAGP